MRYLLTALLLVPALVLAQELHTFKNGEVADAEKINENFQTLHTDIQRLDNNLSISADLTFTSTEFIWTTVQTMVSPKRQISIGEYEERTTEGSLTQDGWDFKTFSKTWLRYPPILNHPKCPEGDVGFPLQYQLAAYANRGAILIESVDQTNGIDPEKDPAGFDSAFIDDLSSPRRRSVYRNN